MVGRIIFFIFYNNFGSLCPQIKIWFQNRRTKWKRKYTSDVETLASQYYAQIGIGGMARPMVVGDRLWLFSQTPSGPAPVQSMMLGNGGGGAAASASAMRSGFPIGSASATTSSRLHAPPPPHQNHPIMDGARNALLSRAGQPLNYGLNKTTPFSSINHNLSQQHLHHHQHLRLSAPPPPPPSTPSINFKPYDHAFLTNKFSQSNGGAFGGGHLRKPYFFGASDLQMGPDDRSGWPIKYQSDALPCTDDGPNEFAPSISGIAELERAFGDRNCMLPNGSGVDATKDVRQKDMLLMALNGSLLGDGGGGGEDVGSDAAAASSSDIDCEEIDEDV